MQFVRRNLGWIVTLTLSLIPVFIWLRIRPLTERFADFYFIFTSLGQIAGLVGMAMFSVNLLLSSRTKDLDDLFGGINKAYVAHHILGGTAFILLMIHPLLLASAFIPKSISRAAFMLIPGTDWAINFGITALLSMMTLLILTFFIKLPYQIWKFSHKFLGLAFFFGGIHAFFITSDISSDPWLRIYMLILIGLGMANYIYRTLLGKYLVPRLTYRVSEIKILNDDTVEIDLVPVKRQLHFVPGQFVFVSFDHTPGVSAETHPFSVSSAPNDGTLSLSIKYLGDWTRKLPHLKLGTQVYIEGAYGKFSYAFYQNPRQVWIAGGIGVTPFVSMAKSLVRPDHEIDLYYSVSQPLEAVYLTDLTSITQTLKGFRVYLWVTKEKGRLTAETVQKNSGDLKDKDIFICGPLPMMRSLKLQFRRLGLPITRLHTEEFNML